MSRRRPCWRWIIFYNLYLLYSIAFYHPHYNCVDHVTIQAGSKYYLSLTPKKKIQWGKLEEAWLLSRHNTAPAICFGLRTWLGIRKHLGLAVLVATITDGGRPTSREKQLVLTPQIRWKCPHFVEISPGCPHKHPLMRLDLRSAIWQPLPATNNKKRSRLQSHQLSVAAVTVDRLAATLTQFSVLSKFLCHHFFWRGQQSQSQLRLPAEKKGWKRNVLVILICYWGRGLWGMDVKMCGVWSSALKKTDVLVKLVLTSSGLPRYDTRVPTPDPNPWLGQDADQRTDLFYVWVLEETGRFCRLGTERPGARRGLDSGPNNRCTTAL